jgi:O-antigen biosynthesis protein
MGISIVVLTYGKWELTHQVLSDIRQFFPADEVVLVDNGSEDKATEAGAKFWKNMLPIKYLRLEENIGFAGGANAGLEAATKRNIALISNDVRITNKWPYTMVSQMGQNELLGGVLHSHDTGWNTFDGKTFPYLEGWFLSALSSVWETLGYFDTSYCPHDYEDIDLSTTALRYGFELKPIVDGLIHKGGGTLGYNPEREMITLRNQERFMKKWL